MTAVVLLIPVLLIRFGFLGILDRDALKRAAFFPPRIKDEEFAYWIYQPTNLAMFVYLFFIKINTGGPLFITGLLIYVLGIILYAVSTAAFARVPVKGFSSGGIYKISRNPMYIGFFVSFAGCVLLSQSLILFIMLVVFQVSSHWIIKSEERWCLKEYGEKYADYMRNVRRYF